MRITDLDLHRADLALLVSLRALLEERGVTAAARRIGVSQPAMSAQLARLRDTFDDPLLIGNAHGMALTPIAEEVLPQLAEGIEILTQVVRDRTPFDPAKSERVFSVASTDYLFAAVVLRHLKSLVDEAPGIRFAMSVLSDSNDLHHSVDLVIATPSMSAQDAIRQLLFRERFVLLMRTGHPSSNEDISLEHFCELDHLIVSPRSASFSGPIDAELAKMGTRRRVIASLPSFTLALQAVQQTDLVAAVPTGMVRGLSLDVVAKPLPFESPEFDVIATWHSKMRNDPGHIWLRSRLIELVRANTSKEA